MYHIPEDRRAKKSAESFYVGLLKLLRRKKFQKLTVAEIVKESTTSRATFYRLFDNKADIILWKCEEIISSTIKEMQAQNSHEFKVAFGIFFEKWRGNLELLKQMEKNHQLGLFVSLHEKYLGEIRDLFFRDEHLSQVEQDFLVNIFAGLIPVALRILLDHPEVEKEEMYAQLRKNYKLIGRLLM